MKQTPLIQTQTRWICGTCRNPLQGAAPTKPNARICHFGCPANGTAWSKREIVKQSRTVTHTQWEPTI